MQSVFEEFEARGIPITKEAVTKMCIARQYRDLALSFMLHFFEINASVPTYDLDLTIYYNKDTKEMSTKP